MTETPPFSSPPSLQANSETPCTVFWDFENCPVPSGKRGFEIAKAISHFVSLHGRLSSGIRAIGNLQILPPILRTELADSGIVLQDVSSSKPSAADIAILGEIMKLIYFNRPPHKIFLISGDRDFSKIVHFLVTQGYDLILIHGLPLSVVLAHSATALIPWTEILNVSNNAYTHDTGQSPLIQQYPILKSSILSSTPPGFVKKPPSMIPVNNVPPPVLPSPAPSMTNPISMSRIERDSQLQQQKKVNCFPLLSAILKVALKNKQPESKAIPACALGSMIPYKRFGYAKLSEYILAVAECGYVIFDPTTCSVTMTEKGKKLFVKIQTRINKTKNNRIASGMIEPDSIREDQELQEKLDSSDLPSNWRNQLEFVLTKLAEDGIIPSEKAVKLYLGFFYKFSRRELKILFPKFLNAAIGSGFEMMERTEPTPSKIILMDGHKPVLDGVDLHQPKERLAPSELEELYLWFQHQYPSIQAEEESRGGGEEGIIRLAQLVHTRGPPLFHSLPFGIVIEQIQLLIQRHQLLIRNRRRSHPSPPTFLSSSSTSSFLTNTAALPHSPPRSPSPPRRFDPPKRRYSLGNVSHELAFQRSLQDFHHTPQATFSEGLFSKPPFRLRDEFPLSGADSQQPTEHQLNTLFRLTEEPQTPDLDLASRSLPSTNGVDTSSSGQTAQTLHQLDFSPPLAPHSETGTEFDFPQSFVDASSRLSNSRPVLNQVEGFSEDDPDALPEPTTETTIHERAASVLTQLLRQRWNFFKGFSDDV